MFSVAALGDPFVEAGPSDRIGRPFGTIPAWCRRWTPSAIAPRQHPGGARAA